MLQVGCFRWASVNQPQNSVKFKNILFFDRETKSIEIGAKDTVTLTNRSFASSHQWEACVEGEKDDDIVLR